MKDKFIKYFKGDTAIWVIIIFLMIFSMLTVYSSTIALAYKKADGNTWYFFTRHLVFLLLGLGITFIVHNISYRFYYSLSKLLLLISIPLLAWTLFNGDNLNDASRWITIPGINLSFQTSDLAKFALILYVARVLANQKGVNKSSTPFRTIIFWVILVCGLIFPADFSTAAMLFLICFALMFIGRISNKYLLRLFSAVVISVTLFVFIGSKMPNPPGRVVTVVHRIESLIDTDLDKDGTIGKVGLTDGNNYQANQAKMAIVNGRYLFGKGPGNSILRNTLPHSYSDFIYAIIIEEYGLVGGFSVLLLYLFLLYRVGFIVRKSERSFPVFLIVGLALSLVIQALINMGVAVNILPVTGQTLPMVSMGGTSIVFTSIAMGIILSVSRTVIAEAENSDEQLGESFIEPKMEEGKDYEYNY